MTKRFGLTPLYPCEYRGCTEHATKKAYVEFVDFPDNVNAPALHELTMWQLDVLIVSCDEHAEDLAVFGAEVHDL